jgi:formate/nitrite transporter FocA (FNT family)
MISRRIVKALEERGSGTAAESQAVSSFLRGLTAGALIGAAIAGSALLQRRRMSKADAGIADAHTPEDSTPSKD